MKRCLCCLLACLLLTPAISAVSEPFSFESKELGFSLTVPGLTDADVTTEVTGSRVDLYHVPSQADGDGLIGSIQVVIPRSAVTAPPYNTPAYRVLAMGTDRAFLWKSPGGVNTTPEHLESFVRAAELLSAEVLREALVPHQPDAWPKLSTQSRRTYLPAESGRIRPDDPLTRGELAQMLCALLDAENLGTASPTLFSDLSGRVCARAASYLASYGIFSGYDDGTFRSDAPVTRAQLAVLLHRCQFAPPAGRYGDTVAFPDVPEEHWASPYIYSACTLGWMNGGSDGAFRPDDAVTRAQAVTAINRMLGRDESSTLLPEDAILSDLSADHWARGNLLEAAGLLPDTDCVQPVRLPDGTSAWYFADAAHGWAAAGTRLYVTSNGGKSWRAADAVLPLTASDLFFFSSNTGLVLGSDGETTCSLWYTLDGGRTWDDFFASPESLRLCLPVDQFPTEASMYASLRSASLRSASLRPAGGDTVYLTVRYRPYGSIYFLDLESVQQTSITFEFASLVIGSR